MPVGPRIDVRAVAATAAGLLLVSLVALASGGSPWHAGGRQDVPVGVVRAIAAAAGALVVGLLLLVWVGTPAAERRRRRRRRLGANDLEDLGKSLSATGKVLAIVAGAIAVFLLLTLPFLVPDASTPTPPAAGPGVTARPHPGTAAPAGPPASTTLMSLVVGSAAALLLLLPAAVVVRRRRARRERRAVVPDAAALVGSGLRRSIADLESEPDARLAVQRAYARMEESLGEIEISRAPDETPAEFTARVLPVLGVSAAAASDLTALFELARFSDHPLGEHDRRRAIASVRRVEAEVAPR